MGKKIYAIVKIVRGNEHIIYADFDGNTVSMLFDDPLRKKKAKFSGNYELRVYNADSFSVIAKANN